MVVKQSQNSERQSTLGPQWHNSHWIDVARGFAIWMMGAPLFIKEFVNFSYGELVQSIY
jgi:hypothetical protein